MKSASNGKTKRKLQALGLAVAVITAGLIAFPSPAQAGNDHGKKKGHRKHVARHYAHRHTYDHVPYRFVAAHRHAYRQHYHGRVYDGRHRHYHEVYRFPVYVSGHVAYRPYAYCGEHVYFEQPVPLPRLAFGLNFSDPGGFYFSGYYQD